MELRRTAIVYLFSKHGYPPEKEWGREFGVLKDIMTKLEIDKNSRSSVVNILRDALVARAEKRNYDPTIGNKNKGRPRILEDGTLEGILVCRALQRGIGITQTVCQLNRFRVKHNKKPISWSAVKGYVDRSPLIKIRKRRTKKSGSKDPLSEWATCRLAQCQELLLRVQMHSWTAEQLAAYDGPPLTPINIYNLMFWDEHHRKSVLGIANKHEYLVSVNIDGDLAEAEPTSEQIVEDVSSLEPTLIKIIAAKGCLVPDEDVRSGVRQAKLNGDGQCKGKTRKSQRIATIKQRPTHPSAMRALELIDEQAVEEFERLDAGVLEHELLAFAEEDGESDGDEEEEAYEEETAADEALALDPDSDEESGDDDGDGEDDEGDEF
jgi:hypothetical protein